MMMIMTTADSILMERYAHSVLNRQCAKQMLYNNNNPQTLTIAYPRSIDKEANIQIPCCPRSIVVF